MAGRRESWSGHGRPRTARAQRFGHARGAGPVDAGRNRRSCAGHRCVHGHVLRVRRVRPPVQVRGPMHRVLRRASGAARAVGHHPCCLGTLMGRRHVGSGRQCPLGSDSCAGRAVTKIDDGSPRPQRGIRKLGVAAPVGLGARGAGVRRRGTERQRASRRGCRPRRRYRPRRLPEVAGGVGPAPLDGLRPIRRPFRQG